MFDLIYNFIYNTIFDSSVLSEELKSNASMFITIILITVLFLVITKLFLWAFNLARRPFSRR